MAMNENDLILIRLKMKELGMTCKNLASKIHTSPTKLDRILNGKDSSELLEKRMINWLIKKS